MPLDRDALERLLPHRGSMCLLDSVASWDADRIDCRASSHRAPENPLRIDGRLPAVVAIEYAAQAMAVHGGLLAPKGSQPTQGYLTSVRGVELHVARLDDVDADLTVEVEHLYGNENTILYGFSICAEERLLLRGRVTVVLDAAKLRDPT